MAEKTMAAMLRSLDALAIASRMVFLTSAMLIGMRLGLVFFFFIGLTSRCEPMAGVAVCAGVFAALRAESRLALTMRTVKTLAVYAVLFAHCSTSIANTS